VVVSRLGVRSSVDIDQSSLVGTITLDSIDIDIDEVVLLGSSSVGGARRSGSGLILVVGLDILRLRLLGLILSHRLDLRLISSLKFHLRATR
jgi:hypothetical protein